MLHTLWQKSLRARRFICNSLGFEINVAWCNLLTPILVVSIASVHEADLFIKLVYQWEELYDANVFALYCGI